MIKVVKDILVVEFLVGFWPLMLLIQKTKKIIIKKGEILDNEKVSLIERSGILSVDVRSPLTCKATIGVYLP